MRSACACKRRRVSRRIPYWALLMLALCPCCRPDPYARVLETNEAFASLARQFIADMDGAEDASRVSSALDEYAAGIEALGPTMRALRERHPELRTGADLPKEVRESQEHAEIWAKRSMAALLKAAQFIDHPEVQRAQGRLAQAFQNITNDPE